MSHFEQIPINQPENKPEQAEKNKQEQGKEQTPQRKGVRYRYLSKI